MSDEKERFDSMESFKEALHEMEFSKVSEHAYSVLLKEQRIQRQEFAAHQSGKKLIVNSLDGRAFAAVLLTLVPLPDAREDGRHEMSVSFEPLSGMALEVVLDDLEQDGFKELHDE